MSRNDTFVVPVRTVRRVLLLLVTLVVIAVFVTVGYPIIRDRLAASLPVDRNGYQAVFLLTNQVYFGKLAIDGDTYLLTDVYYLNTPTQDGTASQLVKRGGEPHGPREPMIIPAKSVLFVENLRDDSPVVVGIKAFKSGQTAPATAAPVATAAPAASGTPRPSASR